MSKVLEAMRKSGPTSLDSWLKLTTLDRVALYPVPPKPQLREFEQLANALIARHEGTLGQVVVFASSSSGEGTSYVSYNVARHLSLMLDRRVAWVDANFRSPQRRLPTEGATFRGMLQSPGTFSELKTAGNLVLVPHGDEPVKSVDLLTSDNYLKLLESFQKSFFFTIMDAPPILESVDVAHLAAPASGLVLVIESRRLKHEVIRHGLEIVRAQRVEVLGTVLNKRVFDIPSFLYRKL